MLLIDYAVDNGYTKAQFDQLKTNIKTIAKAIVYNIKQMRREGNGMYYPISEIINIEADKYTRIFIIQELKILGVEFIEEYTLYRY